MCRRLFIHGRDNGVAYAALFVALGGTAFAAAAAVPPNSIGTAQLKNRAVTGEKTALNTLTGANIKQSTLDFNLIQHRLDSGCSAGQAIRSVAQAGQSTCQSVGFTQVTLRSASNATTSSSAIVSCEAGETLVGGGGQSQVQPMLASIPSGQGWTVGVQNSQAPGTITAYALCAR